MPIPSSPLLLSGCIRGLLVPAAEHADGEAGQNVFIDTMMDPAVQSAFSVQKGSVPARADADHALSLFAARGRSCS
jgi:hypothetical protein